MILAAAVLAQLTCGTTPELVQWARESGEWSQLRAREAASKGLKPASATVRDNLFLLPADDINAPWRRPFDLHGRSLRFSRRGQTGFAVSVEDLQYDNDTGTEIITSVGDGEFTVVSLDFDFPFYERTIQAIFPTDHNAIFVDRPDAPSQRQYGDLDLVTERRGVIAPLMTTNFSQLGGLPTLRAKKSAQSVTITWSVRDRYDVQAVLFRSGDILFSYKEVTQSIAASGIVVSSGNEPWRNERNGVARVDDASNDQRTDLPVAIAPALDITSVEVNRISTLDLYEVRINTRAPLNRSALAPGETIQFTLTLSDAGLQALMRYSVTSTTESYTLPAWSPASRTPAARIDGSAVILTFLGAHLGGSSQPTVRATIIRSGLQADSTSSFALPVGSPTHGVRTDLSAANGEVIDSRPIVEAFTLPVVSVAAVWNQLKESQPSLRDQDVDGVFIYQDFYTDLITYAGAYSTGGNSTSTGLSFGDLDDANQPRYPALMHMNTIGYSWNATADRAAHVVLHELGHRWLLFTSLLENGVRTRSLNPVSAHPAQYVYTPAAFNVFTDADASVMGGGIFRDNGDRSFVSGPQAHYGYSWLDLYLMGLAAPGEVPPFFYISNSTPALGQEYYAPGGGTFQGTRRDVTIQQVIDATGKRSPEYPDTQRAFRVVFVLLTDPDRPLSQEAINAVQSYRAGFEYAFRVATGGRGEASTTILQPFKGPRRRASGR